MALASTGSVSDLASTTVVLLLTVFTFVNISVLVLRRDTIDRAHFASPTIIPVIGAVASAGLLIFRCVDDPEQLTRAVLLLALGVVFWFVNLGGRKGRGHDGHHGDRRHGEREAARGALTARRHGRPRASAGPV